MSIENNGVDVEEQFRGCFNDREEADWFFETIMVPIFEYLDIDDARDGRLCMKIKKDDANFRLTIGKGYLVIKDKKQVRICTVKDSVINDYERGNTIPYPDKTFEDLQKWGDAPKITKDEFGGELSDDINNNIELTCKVLNSVYPPEEYLPQGDKKSLHHRNHTAELAKMVLDTSKRNDLLNDGL